MFINSGKQIIKRLKLGCLQFDNLLATNVIAAKKHVQFNSTSTGGNLIVENNKGIATLKLNKPPANSLNLEFMQELRTTLNEIEKDKSIRGLIITSAVPKIFSAGLDITEMCNPDPKRLREFWRSLQDFWMKMFLHPLTIFSAINGHCPAGGCCIAMSSDYRIMASGNYGIGLNETKLGIVAPFWFMDVMRNTIGNRQTEKALHIGSLFKPDEALKVGMVDEVVEESKILERSTEELQKWLQIPGKARALTKQQLRQPMVDNLLKHQEQDIDKFLQFVTQDSIQKLLGFYMEALKSKKKDK